MGSAKDPKGFHIIEGMKELKKDILERMDKHNANSLLEEELEVRKQIQVESQRLVTDIKRSYESKISALKDEIKNKEELDSHKQELIKELDSLVKQLRSEIKRLNEELKNTKNKEGEVQQRLSKTYRGSISKIESRLHRKSSEVESRVKEIEDKHAEEMKIKVKEYEQLIDELKNSLIEKTDELEELKGRLEESRQAREETLGDLKSCRKKYVESIKDLETKFEEAQVQMDRLRNDNKSQDSTCSYQLEELECQLNETLKENQEIAERLDLSKKENHEKQSRIDELDRIIDRLQSSLNEIEKQKKELYETTQEYILMSKNLQSTDNSAQKVLQDQLEKCQSSLDTTKENLMEERQRTKELQQNMSNMEKDFGLAKVDVRILNREKRILEQKNEKLTEQYTKANGEMETLRVTNVSLGKKVTELEKTLETVMTKREEDAYDIKQVQNMYEEVKAEKKKLETTVKDLTNEINQLQAKVRHDDELKVGMGKRDVLLNEKDQQLQEKDRKIENLQMNIVVLKEASTVLDDQLKDFESLFSRKMAELEILHNEKVQLEEECSTLKDQIKKSRIEINEAKSLKTFVEKRLNEVEGSLKDHDIRSNEQVSSFTRKMDSLKILNEELTLTVQRLTSDLKSVTAEKNDLDERVEKATKDRIKLNEEITRAYNSLIDFKDENITLKTALGEAVKKAESYKSLCEIITKDHEALDVDRYEREVQLESTVSQQLKLIEHLQNQNEALVKKKAGSKFHLFGKTKDDQEFTPSSSKYPGTSRHATPAATPVRLVHEHRAVQSLEEKAASLKQQLALLQDSKEVKTHKEPVLQTPKKEECILLHKTQGVPKEKANVHEFKEKTMMKTEKCWGCMEPIYFSRVSCVCNNCTAVFHRNCADSAGESCGLPREAVIKLEMSRCPEKNVLTEDEDDEFVESSVYVAGEKEWEKHRVRIQDGKFLMYGDGDNSSSVQPLKKFPLNGKTRVELRINKAEVPILIPMGKLPFILKVVTPPEVGLRAWDDTKCMFIMTDNNQQKRFWTRAIFKNSTYKGSSTTIESEGLSLDMKSGTSISGIVKTIVFRDTDNRLDINCTFVVSNGLYLLGCEGGLYSHRFISSQPSTKVKIEGVEAIYQIELIASLNVVVMIEGEDRNLIIVHMGMLRVCAEAAACSKPKLTVESVADIKNCHLFQVQAGGKGEVYIAAATPKHLYILSWDGDQFLRTKRINTKETVTCMLMTPNSVIFGSDRVYELDIKNYQLEEFIDNSDDSLYYIRFACDMFASFPVAILDVGMSNWNPVKGSCTTEYLLCFPDMGVFVDSFGRRTRGEDIVWSKLPLAIAYRHPNLFILHFSSVEIIRLESDSYTRTRVIESTDSIGKEYVFVPDSRFLYLTSPRFLGTGGKTASILVSSLEKQKTEMFELYLEWSIPNK